MLNAAAEQKRQSVGINPPHQRPDTEAHEGSWANRGGFGERRPGQQCQHTNDAEGHPFCGHSHILPFIRRKHGDLLSSLCRYATGEGLRPSRVAVTPPAMQMSEGPAYGTVTVVPSPLAVMENVPVLLDV